MTKPSFTTNKRRKRAPKTCPKCKSKNTYKAVIGRVCQDCRLRYTTSYIESIQYGYTHINLETDHCINCGIKLTLPAEYGRCMACNIDRGK